MAACTPLPSLVRETWPLQRLQRLQRLHRLQRLSPLPSLVRESWPCGEPRLQHEPSEGPLEVASGGGAMAQPEVRDELAAAPARSARREIEPQLTRQPRLGLRVTLAVAVAVGQRAATHLRSLAADEGIGDEGVVIEGRRVVRVVREEGEAVVIEVNAQRIRRGDERVEAQREFTAVDEEGVSDELQR